MSARKPLELAVYDLEAFPHLVAKARATTRRKRLSDAELAAEMWRARLKVCSRGNRDVKRVGHPCVEWRAAHDEYDTLHRFATYPHYDEADQ